MKTNFSTIDKFLKFLALVSVKKYEYGIAWKLFESDTRYFDETARDSVLFDDISYAHFVCNLKVIQLQVVRRIPDGFMGKPFYLPPTDKRCNSISKDYLVPSKVLCTLYQLQIYLGKFCSSFMNRARILKLPSCGPQLFPHKRWTHFFLRNLFTVSFSYRCSLFSSCHHWYRPFFSASFLRSSRHRFSPLIPDLSPVWKIFEATRFILSFKNLENNFFLSITHININPEKLIGFNSWNNEKSSSILCQNSIDK